MLHQIQAEIKAPKGQFNKFGNYKYRSCEDIVEAAKPVLNKYKYSLQLSDEIVNIGNRFYVKATAEIKSSEGGQNFSATAFAREDETIKGMAAAQITGSASSYARKYALNGLFAIDDTKDADATNTHDHENGFEKNKTVYEDFSKVVVEEDRQVLRQLVYSSDLTNDEKEAAMAAIETCPDYDRYAKIQHKLEARQQPFDTIQNPNQRDINKHLKNKVKA